MRLHPVDKSKEESKEEVKKSDRTVKWGKDVVLRGSLEKVRGK